ncbi:MAG: hypothetical protein KAG64_06135 [Bacteroidales bacterium]|nr:hypothetical protein [Bacteroidales bacterium]
MKNILLIIIVSLLVLSSCMKNECPDCTNPPPPLYFYLIDSKTDSDLIANGRLVPDSFILYSSSINPVSWDIVEENGKMMIDLSDLMWTEGDSQHRIAVKGTDTTARINIDFGFTTTKDTLSDDCCTIYENSKFKIYNQSYERDVPTGFTKIKMKVN